MNTLVKFIIPLALVASGAASAQGDQKAVDDRNRFEKLLEHGTADYQRSWRLDRPAQKLAALDHAEWLLRRARKISLGRDAPSYDDMKRSVEPVLVSALCDEAWLHVGRNSLSRATANVDEALAIDPADSRALNLAARILELKKKDLYDDSLGSTAVNRIRDRRAAVGIATRDRGVSLRR